MYGNWIHCCLVRLACETLRHTVIYHFVCLEINLSSHYQHQMLVYNQLILCRIMFVYAM
jgi:hypothetical protein